MLATVIYVLCAIASAVCAWALYRSFSQAKSVLLLWCSLSFVTLFIGNILLVVDLVITGSSTDLSLIRGLVSFVGFSVLLYGLIWETV